MKFPFAALCLIALLDVHAESPAAAGRRVNLFTGLDIGRLESGRDLNKNYDPTPLTLNRTYVDVTVAQQLDEKYFLSVGVGGIFWKAFELETGEPEAKVIKFGPGISNAFMKYSPNESWNLTFGYFPYKYNASARNLGEYMFRSEAYPTIIFTGGWVWMNDAQVRTPGLKLTHESATFKQDFCLFGEYFNSPIYDFSPAYIATWKPSGGLTLGGGVDFHRYLSPNTSINRELRRKYYYYDNFYIPAAPDGSLDKDRPVTQMSRLTADIRDIAGKDLVPDSVYINDPKNAGKDSQLVEFDNRAIKLMAFFTLDFNGLLGLDPKSMGAFELYGEAALLGLKNYPIFYTKYTERLPIMVGASIPTFGLLNNLSIEAEYLNNPNVESLGSTFDVLDLPPDATFRYKTYNRDNLKWSVHASRELTSFLSLYVQVADDHMRLKDKNARPSFVPVTQTGKDWYWLVRLQWAI